MTGAGLAHTRFDMRQGGSVGWNFTFMEIADRQSNPIQRQE